MEIWLTGESCKGNLALGPSVPLPMAKQMPTNCASQTTPHSASMILQRRQWSIASLPAHTLLGLVAETTGLVGAGGASSAVDGRQLAELPRANAQKEPEHVRLLLLVKLLEVLVGAHGSEENRRCIVNAYYTRVLSKNCIQTHAFGTISITCTQHIHHDNNIGRS